MNILDKLNDEQIKAVTHNKGPLLVLAGAGSGKTRVLTYRIAYLITEYNVSPWNIIALTFTNKAAGEMRERIDDIVGAGSENIWVSTFHSTCVRILRRFGESIGYNRNFTIYDSDDSKSVMKSIIKRRNLDKKSINEKKALSVISANKNALITPSMYAYENEGDYRAKLYAELYTEYQDRLLKSNALDFDDLIMKTVELFKTDAQALAYYRRRFAYILVDEYQDTNTAQFELLKLLAEPGPDNSECNICVVGDDDQSIYKFRGANIYNILNFEKIFPDTTTIRLEQNYRSTRNILNAANGVISNNTMRKEKKLWSKKGDGIPIDYIRYGSDFEEACGIVSSIKQGIDEGNNYKDYAILYRTNAQSRIFEENLVNLNIPYKIVGGLNFYSRKEIKDIIAYLKTIDNGLDDIAVRRIINIPRRGIGLTTIDRIMNYADIHEISFYEALKDAEYIDGIGRSKTKLTEFVALIEHFRELISQDGFSVEELVKSILSDTGYMDMLTEEDTDEANARIENIEEFINKTITFALEDYVTDSSGNASVLSQFLENVALVSEADTIGEDSNVVLLMTLHGAKGLEFPHVFIAGMEDGIFPSDMSIYSLDSSELEEERRLCYVGITRAMETLTISSAARRMKNGETMFNAPSRFIYEIPRYLIKESSSEGYISAPSSASRRQTDAFSSVSYRQPDKTGSSCYTKKGSNLFLNNPYISKGLKSGSKVVSDISEIKCGDRVKHIKFGEGTVTDISGKSGDSNITVSFDEYGIRKMKASFAKLTKI